MVVVLVKMERLVNSSKYQSMLVQNLKVCAGDERNFTFRHDNNPKSIKECLHQKEVNVLECPSQAPVWGNLKRAVHWRCPHNLTKLEHFYKPEWERLLRQESEVIYLGLI